jgi:hypothetical protein
MNKPVIIPESNKMHRGNDIPFVERQKKTKQNRE